jgi:DNA-binding cell septation regulator SpoVG
MQIQNYRPGRPGARTRAHIDVRFPDGLFIRDLRLVETRNGVRVYGPTIGDRTIVALPPAVADKIAEAVAHAAA